MIIVLRLGHRLKRDERISTHCGLVARAFGADKIIYSGEKDEKMLATLRSVAERWGGRFAVGYESNWRKIINEYRKKKYTVIHLTMYSIPLEKTIGKIKKQKNILVIIGSEKVPSEVYGLVDYNVAVTNQPHSEVAALAVFLNLLGRKKAFSKAKLKIIPQEKGKKVIER